MPSPPVHPDPAQTKRQLRLRIGRLRRRIDGRLRQSGRRGRELLSWRTYVRRWPGNAVAVALGAGLALSAGLSARRLTHWVGLRLLNRAASQGGQLLWQEIAQIWADSAPQRNAGNPPAANPGADDVRH